MKIEQTQCSETSAIKHHTPENNPKGYTWLLILFMFLRLRHFSECGVKRITTKTDLTMLITSVTEVTVMLHLVL
jgi:hypothetical protein